MVMLVFTTCGQDQSVELKKLSYHQVEINKKSCVGEGCAEVKISYPVFDGKKSLAKKINLHVNQQMIMYLRWGENHLELDSLLVAVNNFLEKFTAIKREFPESHQSWYVEALGNVTCNTSKFLSLSMVNDSYTGGAHPNQILLFMNFDMESGKLLKNDDVVLDDSRLLVLAEEAFRNYHHVKPEESLAEDGRFFLKNERFFLPAAIGYEGDDLVLYYNSYEIAPYAMGPTELRIPLEDLKGIVFQP